MADSLHVLHVANSPDAAETVAERLRREDDRISVETATSACAGLEQLDGGVDCIVSEYDLTDTDGIDFLESVRETYPDLPFILFSRAGSEAVASEAISTGVTDYLRNDGGGDRYARLAERIVAAVETTGGRRSDSEELERQRDLFEKTQDLADVGAWEYDLRSDELYWTDEVARMCGLSPDYEPTVDDSIDFYHPDDRAEMRAAFERAREEGEPYDVEARIRTADDEIRWVRTRGEPQRSDGEITRIRGTIQDITDRKERERELEAQKAKIRALHAVAARINACDSSDAVYDAVVGAAEAILDFDITIADAAVEDVLVPRAVSTELSTDEYFQETRIEDETNLGAEAYRTGEPSVIDDLRETEAVPADSEFRSVLTVPIGDYGVLQSVAREPGVFDEQDLELAELLVAHARARLSQLEARRELQQRSEELERQNERLDEFTSFVSHDLQSPLNVAQGRLELAQEECDSEHLDHVEDAHERMRNLIDDLLALAREEKAPTEYESVALGELVEHCWRTVETKDATLQVDVEATIRADHDRLRQLLENLLRNAVDHGGEDVTITVGELDDGFYVADDGEGIPESERDRIFESGYSTAREGTGFGLSIVKKIADAHGWTIDVTESDDGGARFEITGVDAAR